MILLRDKGLVFIKGAKVAGTSIEVFLARHATERDIVTPISPPAPGHSPRNHAGPDGAALFYNHMPASEVAARLGRAYFDGLRRFGVVREPVDKVRSTFAMQFVLNEGRYDMDRAIEDTWSEADKYCDASGACLLTDVIRYEDLEGGLRRLFAQVGIPFERLAEAEKTGYRRLCPAIPELTAEQRERIARKFAWEYRNFYGEDGAPRAAASRAQVAAAGGADASMGTDRGRKGLVEWHGDPENMSLQNLDTWYLGSEIHVVPGKAEFAERGIESILEGWRPSAPLIGRDTRVIGVGSCFARYFILWLAESGFNRQAEESPYNALLRYGATFESPAVVAQQFRWAFDEVADADTLWIDKGKEVFEANEERRRLVRRTLEQTDVLIVTLGLSEVWYDNRTGEPLWRALTRRHYDPARHVFRVETLQDTKRHLEKIEDIRQRHLPGLKIVFTVSPVRMTATFRPISAITANSVSKAILRAALDEFLREHGALLNRELFYFPSYEIVHDYFRDPFEEDNRHVAPFVASQVVRAFASHYCDPEMLRAQPAACATGSAKLDNFLGFAERDAAPDERAARIADLERQVDALQRTCDERMRVIRDLDHAASERLALIERLSDPYARLRRLLRWRRSG